MKKIFKAVVASLVIATSLCSCFSSNTFNNKKAISVISREDGSGTRGAFIEIFGIEKKDENGKKVDYTTEEAAITNSTAVMMTSVSGDKYAIGYVSLGSLNDSVKAVQIDGSDATVQNINNGSYKISRPFNIAIKDDISDATQDFLGFILSDDGQNVVSQNKYIQIKSKPYTSTKPSGKVVISGSSSVSPLMEKMIEAYKTINPNAQIELQTSDSTTGVQNTINNTCDIGMASRALKDSEKSKGVKEVTIAIDLLAGIPSVVYGFFGLMVIVPFVRNVFGGNGSSILTASILLGMMILPTIISVSETSLNAVPQNYYEGSRALGATHERSVFMTVLPAAKSGIMAGIILGIGRAIGETMAVIMVAGNQARIPDSILKGVRTLTANIVIEMGYATDLHREALIATGVVLFVFILLINLSFNLEKKGSGK